jgi:hypothetical protein
MRPARGDEGVQLLRTRIGTRVVGHGSWTDSPAASRRVRGSHSIAAESARFDKNGTAGSAVGFDALAPMDNAAGRIEARLQQVATQHSRHCLGKTSVQTLGGMAERLSTKRATV